MCGDKFVGPVHRIGVISRLTGFELFFNDA